MNSNCIINIWHSQWLICKKRSVGRGRVKCELRVSKLRVGILRVEVRAKRASIWVKCETSECARCLPKIAVRINY